MPLRAVRINEDDTPEEDVLVPTQALAETDLAYLAAIIDTMAVIRSREVTLADGKTVLPFVALHDSRIRILERFAAATGTKVTEVRRAYAKGGCAEHCKEKHQHIKSLSYRWSVSGAKATVLLVAIRPYLVLQGAEADLAIEMGLRAPRKYATGAKMARLGWPLPQAWLDLNRPLDAGCTSRLEPQG